MPGYLVHEEATVYCMHAGEAEPTVADQRVKIDGNKVVTVAAGYQISDCQNPLLLGGPCITAVWIVPSLRVRASGLPVLLQDSQSKNVLNGTSLIIAQTQTKVRGM